MANDEGEYKYTRDQQRQLDKYKSERLAHRSGDKEARKSITKEWKPFNMNKSMTAGKGDNQRPSSVSPEVYELRYDLAIGKITMEEFQEKMKGLENG